MRIPYSFKDLDSIYEKLVRKSQMSFRKKRYNRCVKCIAAAAHLQYYYNHIYTDKRLNNLLRDLSSVLFDRVEETYNSNTVIFYDSFCWDNRGLTQHYLDALVSTNHYRIILISEHPLDEKGNDIKKYIEDNDIELYTLPNEGWREQAYYVYNIIKRVKPCAALFHLTPATVIPFLAFNAFPSIRKYQINLTDHAFWLGDEEFFDYSYEFRDYGVTVSLEKRGFRKEQLILNPYYPWQSDTPFQGFPISTEGKVVLFSGGSMYKTEGEDGMYFFLLKQVLDKHPTTVFFYAGTGNSAHFESFIKDNHYQDRVFLIGNRKDINAVFQHCDIYISTYPLIGGLMTQYAAMNAKSILVYNKPEIEALVSIKGKVSFNCSTISEYLNEADKLICDIEYRVMRGAQLQSALITQDDFRRQFSATFIKDSERVVKPILSIIDYEDFSNSYISRINSGSISIERVLIGSMFVHWKIVLNSVLQLPKMFKKVINKYFRLG